MDGTHSLIQQAASQSVRARSPFVMNDDIISIVRGRPTVHQPISIVPRFAFTAAPDATSTSTAHHQHPSTAYRLASAQLISVTAIYYPYNLFPPRLLVHNSWKAIK